MPVCMQETCDAHGKRCLAPHAVLLGGCRLCCATQTVEAHSQQALNALQGGDLEESLCVHVPCPGCRQAVACAQKHIVCFIAACRLRGALLSVHNVTLVWLAMHRHDV